MRIKIFIAIIVSELIALTIVGVNFYNKRSNVLGTAISVNPLQKSDLVFSEENGLKLFYEPKPNTIQQQNAPFVDGTPRQTINNDTLNERFDYQIEKPRDVFRIITLGDSYTYGLFVKTEDNFPEQLEDLLNQKTPCGSIKKFEVINLGVGGYDVKYSVERFRKRGQKYSPDLIIWLLKNDDFQSHPGLINQRKEQYEQEMKKSGEFQKLQKDGQYNPAWVKASKEIIAEYGQEKLMEYEKEALYEIPQYTNIPLVIFSFPFLKGEYKKIIKDFTAASGNVYFDDEFIDIYKDQRYYFIDRHPTPEGYKIISSTIADFLSKKRLVPC